MIPWHPLSLDVDPLDDLLVDFDLVKKQAYVVVSDDDELFLEYLRAAIEEGEGFMHRTIIRRGHRWTLNRFPIINSQALRLPRGKTISVGSIRYSLGGSILTLTGPSASPIGTGFQEDLGNDNGGIVMPPRGGCWPDTDCDVPTPVAIHFTAGYSEETLPADIVHWIRFAVADSIQHRDTGDSPFAEERARVMKSLLSPYVLNRLY